MLGECISRMWQKILKVIKNPVFIITVIAILGLILRLLDINKTSFWYDEAFTGDTIKLGWKEMFAVIAADKVHPPIFYIMIRLWSYIFGMTQVSLRGFSIFFGVDAIILAFLIGKNIFDKNKFPIVGTIASLAIALSPFFITYSNEARSYSFLAFVALGLSFTVIKWIDSKKIKYFIFSLLLAILLCATHYLQIIFVIAIVCTALIYKFIFTEKGINKKGLKIGLGILIIAILGLIFLPLKSFITSHGISGMWWIPDIEWYEIARVYYSYFLGVVRYMDGVPPMRDLIINIPKLLVAGILFGIHTLSYIYILISKRFNLEIKRHITFYYLLGIITFLGFYILSVIGFNAFIERYTIAGGIILFVSFWFTIATVLRNWFILIPLSVYVTFVLMLVPMPTRIDYREVAKVLDSMNNVSRYVFTSPTDLVDSEFYMDHTNVYYLYDFKGEYPGWALLKEDVNGIYSGDIKDDDLLIVPNYDRQKYIDLGYTEVSTIGKDLYILQK